jgi:hypothetical protein
MGDREIDVAKLAGLRKLDEPVPDVVQSLGERRKLVLALPMRRRGKRDEVVG